MAKARLAPSAERKTRTRSEDVVIPDQQHFVTHGVSWEQYVAIADAFPERPIRVNYDDGLLEIMTVSNIHERLKMLVDRMLLALSGVYKIPVGGFGSFTHRKKSVLKAMEPDQCYYIANLEKVGNQREIDLEKDPPPDLVIEVEISRSLLSRMKILAGLGVPEVWRLDETGVEVNLLEKEGYRKAEESPTFPGLNLHEMLRFLLRFLSSRPPGGDVEMMQAFQKWVRSQRRKSKRGGK